MFLILFKMRLLRIFFTLAVLGVCFYILLFQAEWLGINLFKKSILPFGTFLSWFMIIDFSLLVCFFFPSKPATISGRMLKMLSKIFVLLSCSWGILSFLLAGNWSWNFADKIHFYIWAILTIFLVLSQLIILFILIFRSILKRGI